MGTACVRPQNPKGPNNNQTDQPPVFPENSNQLHDIRISNVNESNGGVPPTGNDLLKPQN